MATSKFDSQHSVKLGTNPVTKEPVAPLTEKRPLLRSYKREGGYENRELCHMTQSFLDTLLAYNIWLTLVEVRDALREKKVLDS